MSAIKLSILVVLGLLLGLVCSQTVRIAVPQPLTGKYSSLAYSVLNATLLWQKNVNARGGFNINGVNYQVEIIQSKDHE
jgi:ABC-type branched-subunit amino acid transport system substrate-binding protein